MKGFLFKPRARFLFEAKHHIKEKTIKYFTTSLYFYAVVLDCSEIEQGQSPPSFNQFIHLEHNFRINYNDSTFVKSSQYDKKKTSMTSFQLRLPNSHQVTGTVMLEGD